MAPLSNDFVIPSQVPGSATIAKKLIVAWSCGLLFGWAIFGAVYLIGSLAVAAIVSLGGFDAGIWIVLILCLALLVMLPGPILLGRYLSHSWRRGLSSGLIALLMIVAVVFIFYWVAAIIDPVFAHNIGVFYALLAGLPAAGAVSTVIWKCTDADRHRMLGLVLGLILGLGLVIVSGIVLERNLLSGNDVFHLIWQAPALVWVSAIYLPELAAGRGKWSGLLIWMVLVLATFGLTFVVAPVLPLK